MDSKNIQTQIDEINSKVDLILEYVNQQRLNSSAVNDLVADISIVGKDIYDTAVSELEHQDVEIDPEELKSLGIRLVKNIRNFNTMMGTLESFSDLMRDVGPIANELIIDFTKKLNEFEQKGYFEFMLEMGHVMDNVITHFSREDVRQLADNAVTILETVKSLTQPEMMKALDNGLRVYGSIEMEDIPQYSFMRLLREMRQPEMKRSLGFMVTFLKNLSSQNIK